MTVDYTLVVGVDGKHLQELFYTWPTWKRNKQGILNHPMVVFGDSSVRTKDIKDVVDHPDLRIYSWPPSGSFYPGNPKDKWTCPQRYKMLAGFVHVPAAVVKTKYFLKIDTDAVATPRDGPWIDPKWFDSEPAIVAHRWTFTKPPDQIIKLDEWAEGIDSRCSVLTKQGIHQGFFTEPPLDIRPASPDADRVGHERIISWCGFFNTDFARACAQLCDGYTMPCRSQDGFHWYCAKRMGLFVRRVNMKKKGWEHWGTMHNVKMYSELAMQ